MKTESLVVRQVVVPPDALSVRHARSSGPGGQNVNKVSTKVELRFYPAKVPTLSAAAWQRLRHLAGSRLNKEEEIVIVCEQTRSQPQNLRLALERLKALLEAALTPPKRRRRTQPSVASKRRRLETKRKHSALKQARHRPTEDG